MSELMRIQPLGRPWETFGSDRLRGIVPKGIEASSDDWGPSAMNFVVAAERGARRPDLLPYTPIEFEVDGLLSWAGFVWQRPTDENGYSVGCRGWQFHLDDDLLDRVYVHTRLGEYRDQRSFLSANLTLFKVSGSVSTDGGTVMIGWPSGTVVPINGAVGVTLDLGPDSTWKRAVLDWDSSNNNVNLAAVVRGNDSEDATVAGNDAFSFSMASGASGTSAGTIATTRRYVHVFLLNNSGVAQTLGADLQLRLKGLKIFRDVAYESGNASILKADAVIKDALALAPLLNQSTSRINVGTFSIIECLTRGYLPPRQLMEMVNAYERYRLKIGAEDLRTAVFEPKPSTPQFEIGEWSGAEFSDATVSGEEIYDGGITDATGPDGARLVSKRNQTGTLVDRRGFHRKRVLPISAAVTSAVADRFGDLWLAEHKTTPFSGQIVVRGTGAVRRHLSGVSVPPASLLRQTGEKVRLSNRVDPDTGAWGRDGRIAAVTYRHDSREAELTIDDRPVTFEKTLARYQVLSGQ